MELTVECQKRQPGTKPKALRRSGLIPANLYGHKGNESISLTLNAKTAERLLVKASVNNTLIQVNIPELRWRGKTLLREVQTHPAKGSLYHLSFFAIAGQESIEVEVPIHFVGEAPGVKLEGGVLDAVLSEFQVRCAPDNIPDMIEIDISQLHVKDTLYVHQIVVPEGITLLGDSERAVATLLQAQVNAAAEDEAEAEAAAAAEVAPEEDTQNESAPESA